MPELNAGFDLLYVQKFAEARQIFASWESRNQEDPFGEVAMAASYRARELAKVRQKTNPNDGEALLALTLAAGMESDAESILQKKHMNGLRRMKEANKYAECLLANYPDSTDAYIALGIANYIIGSQSAGSRFALWFDGIHGDKKLGMEQVAILGSVCLSCWSINSRNNFRARAA